MVLKKYNSVGTFLALNALKNNHKFIKVLVNVKPRKINLDMELISRN